MGRRLCRGIEDQGGGGMYGSMVINPKLLDLRVRNFLSPPRLLGFPETSILRFLRISKLRTWVILGNPKD